MRKIKIIALFLLIFSFGFSEESSQEELKTRVTQLEQQIETQNKIIARYERLEDNLNDRLLENSSLSYNVDQFYNSAWNKLQTEVQDKIDLNYNNFQDRFTWTLWIIAGAFAGIGIILPYLQNRSMSRTLDKIEDQEKKVQAFQKGLEKQRKKDLDEHNHFNRKINLSLAENQKLSAEMMISNLGRHTLLHKQNNYNIIFEKLVASIELLVKNNAKELNHEIAKVLNQFFDLCTKVDRSHLPNCLNELEDILNSRELVKNYLSDNYDEIPINERLKSMIGENIDRVEIFLKGKK